MRPEQLDELNAVLRDPPVTGLALGRSLGCLVAARLAARHGITVRLRAGEGDGVAAYVILPAAPPGGGAGRAASTPPRRRGSRRRSPRPARCRDAAPERARATRCPRDRLRRRPPGAPRREGEPTLVEPPLATRRPAAGPGADGVRSLTPSRARAPRPRPCRNRSSSRRCGASPDEVRALLSRYRSGLEAGRERRRGPGSEEERS